jgi:hypothetical protein
MDRRVLVVLLLVASAAEADKKIQGMTPGFQREAQTCAVQVSGLKKVQTGATALAPTLAPEDKTALDKDLEDLKVGIAGVESYCAEVTALVAFLEANKTTSYKAVEKELDARDNTVRKLRKLSKQIIEKLTPITRRWIGKIAQNQIREPDEVRPKPTRFPSGRTAVLPRLGNGQWSVSGDRSYDAATYTEPGVTLIVHVAWGAGDNCDAARKRSTPTPIEGGLPKVEGLEVAWHGGVDPGSSKGQVEMLCARSRGGTSVAKITQEPGTNPKLAVLRQLALDLALAQATSAKPP